MVKKTKYSQKRSKVGKRVVEKGKVYISATFNNTLITVCDEKGAVLTWGSAGLAGFKGTRKSTPYAANTAMVTVIRKAIETHGLREIEIYLKGPGSGREAALRAIRGIGIKISLIADITPIPHNGPRPRKKRRV